MVSSAQDVAAAVGVTPSVVAARLAAMQLDHAARERLRRVAPTAALRASAFLDALYARLRSHPETGALVSSDAQVQRLKVLQARYLSELLGSEIDWDYALGRLWTGVVHHRVRLSPRWYIATYAHFVCDNLPLLFDGGDGIDAGIDRTLTLLRSVLFDASLVLDAYGHSEEASIWLRAQQTGPDRPAASTAPREGEAQPHPTTAATPGVARIRLNSQDTTERRRFLDLGDRELATLRTLSGVLTQSTPAILDDFYALFSSHSETAALIAEDDLPRLERLVAAYWLEVAEGHYDQAHAASRMRLGVIHEKIGLSLSWYLTGLVRQMSGFLRAALTNAEDPVAVASAFVKAVFFDISFVIDAYLEARTERLLRTEGYANQLVATLASAVAVVDAHDRLISANRTLLSLVGGEPAVLYLMPLESALPMPEVVGLVHRVRREGVERTVGLGRLGERTLQVTAMRLAHGTHGRDPEIALVLDDVTDFLRVTSDYRSRSLELDRIADAADVVLWEMQIPSWTMTVVNRSVFQVLGWRDMHFLGRAGAWLECIAEEFRPIFRDRLLALAPGARLDLDYRMRSRAGREVWVRTRLSRGSGASEDRILGATVDVSALRIDDKLRLDAIGQMAGGVAHVINNALTVVLGNLEMQAELLGGADKSPLLAAATQAGERAVAMARKLLAFAGRQVLRPVPLQPLAVARRERLTLETILGPSVTLVLRESPSPWNCRLDPEVLASALGCLASNARNAMERAGTVTISTENVPADRLPPTDPGFGREWVELGFRDTGRGMSPEVRTRAAEPFFTTQSRAEVPGLGLSMVYGFVAQSGGHLILESEPEQGTLVRLRFPRLPTALALHEGPAIQPNGLTVLIVEDDVLVRTLTVQVAQRLGYHVIQAADSREASAALHKARPDILVADVILKNGEDGISVARTMVAARPDLALILMSGYAWSHFDLEGLPATTHFLAKPFGVAVFEQTLAAAAKLAR